MRHIITVYCDDTDVRTLKRAILRVRDNIQNNGGKGDIVVFSQSEEEYEDRINDMVSQAEAMYEAGLTDWAEWRQP